MVSIFFLCISLVLNTIQNTSKVSAFNNYTLSVPQTNTKDTSPCVLLKAVTLQVDNTEPQKMLTCKTTVGEVLAAKSFAREKYEYANGAVQEGQSIKVASVTRTRKLVWQPIPYAKEETYSNKIAHRKRVYTQKGQTGVMGVVVETITYANGKSKTLVVEKWREKEPVTEIVTIGSKYPMQKTVVNGVVVNYWKKLTVVATSYDKNCLGCNDTTATGAKLTKGIIAVDPRVIPLHTRMYVPGYGFGKAEDVGGAVKGNKIDLAYDDLRYGDWSKRTVTIYIID